MNKLRRKEILRIIELLRQMQKQDLISDEELSDICDQIREIYDEEEYYMDSIPENLQGGYRYDRAEEACDLLESAADSIEYAIGKDENKISDSIDEAIQDLYDAM